MESSTVTPISEKVAADEAHQKALEEHLANGGTADNFVPPEETPAAEEPSGEAEPLEGENGGEEEPDVLELVIEGEG